jgi:hypothetical protein
MTNEERRNFLMLVCDCEEFFREKETYKAYLASAAAEGLFLLRTGIKSASGF